MTNKASPILFLIIILLALVLRIIWINQTPPGVYLDEASIGYDAYSLVLTGKDQYGASFPIYFRSYANYQSPLYIYLSAIPIKIFGLTPIGVRLVSILSGLMTVVLTFFLVKLFVNKKEATFPLISSFIIAIAPWAISFSRSALEANLALNIFILSLFLLLSGIFKKRKYVFLSGFIALALTNYAYQAYKIVSFGTIILLVILFLKQLSKDFKKIFIAGSMLFLVILTPQFILLNTSASLSRYNSLEYISQTYFEQNGGDFKSIPLGQFLFISKTFLGKFFDYLSPKSIFFDSDPTAVRSIPELGAFYQWMIIPFLFGLIFILKRHPDKTVILFGLIALISIIPAAITRDNLYLLRVLSYLWTLSILISLGLNRILNSVRITFLKLLLLIVITLLSLGNFYINYFHILRNERIIEQSGLLNQLFSYTKIRPKDIFVVDLTEPLSFGVALFIYQYSPQEFAGNLQFDLTKYYSDTILKTDHRIGNLDIRPINWEKDTKMDLFLIGDEQTIPNQKATYYGLNLIQQFRVGLDNRYISIYKTNSK